MAGLNKSIDSILSKMRTTGGTGKGEFGEDAVFKICERIYQIEGGILYHSFTYKTDKDLAGNIKRSDTGTLYVENLSSTTEIDVLLVTPFKIFPLEVKAYKAKNIVLTTEGISGCYKTDKSPIHQNEMHCRHLYPPICSGLPKGMTKYIEPIVVFVDNCTIKDQRSQQEKDYIKVTTLNRLESTLKELDKPLSYRLDLELVQKKLKNICVSSKKCLPLRIM